MGGRTSRFRWLGDQCRESLEIIKEFLIYVPSSFYVIGAVGVIVVTWLAFAASLSLPAGLPRIVCAYSSLFLLPLVLVGVYDFFLSRTSVKSKNKSF